MGKLIHWPTFFITVLLTSLFMFVFIALRLKIGLDCSFEYKKLKKLKKKAKTGDLLVVAYGSKRAKLVKVFTGSMWTHCAVVVKLQNEIRVMEVAHYAKGESGIILKSLDDWMEKNSNCLIGYRSYSGPPISEKVVKTFIYKNCDIQVDLNVVSWLKSMYKVKYSKENKAKKYCSEFIVSFLQDSNLLAKKYKPAGYKPWELLYGNLPMKSNHSYQDAVLLED